jgi:hypothetical protein
VRRAAMGYNQYGQPRRRPIGVAILAILVGAFGFLLLLSGALLLVGVAGHAIVGLPTTLFGIGGPIAGLVALIVGIVLLGLGLGLWNLRMWAYVLTLVFVLFELVSFGLAGGIVTIGFLFLLFLLVYLLVVARFFR